MKVTVLLATYNRERTVGRAIESFLNQDYLNSDLIILNDGSPDNTSEVLAKYKGNPRITIHEFTDNKLPPNNWNWLWSKVTDADLICQLHDDDELTIDSITKRVNLFKADQSIQCVWGGAILQSLNGDYHSTFLGQEPDKLRIWKDEYINFTTLMYRPNIPFRFESRLRYYFDWHFKIKCVTELKCGYTPGPVMKYSLHSDQESHKAREGNFNPEQDKLMRELL